MSRIQKLGGDHQLGIDNEAELVLADISKLPFFSQDLENDPPDTVCLLKDQIREADAILFITPEYNHSMTAPIKNAIDWGNSPLPYKFMGANSGGNDGCLSGNIETFGAQLLKHAHPELTRVLYERK